MAKTERRVTISDATMTLEGVGMELNSETRVLKLKAGVRGAYHDEARIAELARTGRR